MPEARHAAQWGTLPVPLPPEAVPHRPPGALANAGAVSTGDTVSYAAARSLERLFVYSGRLTAQGSGTASNSPPHTSPPVRVCRDRPSAKLQPAVP